MKILLLSAYDAMSHRIWREGLVETFSNFNWTTLTLPPRHFGWRIRSNGLTWAYSQQETLNRHHDLVIATSMCDLTTLRGLMPALAKHPTLVYFHENQFAYPKSEKAYPSIEHKLVTLYTALAADRVLFNSEFNRTTFLDGSKALLEKMPDGVPAGIIEHLHKRSETLPVPLDDSWYRNRASRDKNEVFTLLWNHRWEYDKAPERFLRALLKLTATGRDFRVNVIGQQFRDTPPIFHEIRPALEAHIDTWGTIKDTERYRKILRQSHIVISTALHDFQGLAVLEAVASGCIPIVPDRLAYRETIDTDFRFASYPDDTEREIDALVERLIRLEEQHRTGILPRAPDVSHLSWCNLKPAYQAAIDKTLVTFNQN